MQPWASRADVLIWKFGTFSQQVLIAEVAILFPPTFSRPESGALLALEFGVDS
jgi:hypothetical protein